MNEILALLGSFLLSTARLAVPLLLASIAALICYRAGIVNVAIEGTMMLGAFGAALGSYQYSSGWVGLIYALIFGLLASVIFGTIAIPLRHHLSNVDILAGLAINLLAVGITKFLSAVVFGNIGYSPRVESPPLTPLAISAVVVGTMAYLAMHHTIPGRRLLAVGYDERVAYQCGVHAALYKWTAVLASAGLAGLAGAYLTFHINAFVHNSPAGRGFIALAVIIAARYSLIRILGLVFLFSFLDLFAAAGHGLLPFRLVQSIPYLFTIIVLMFLGRSTVDAGSG